MEREGGQAVLLLGRKWPGLNSRIPVLLKKEHHHTHTYTHTHHKLVFLREHMEHKHTITFTANSLTRHAQFPHAHADMPRPHSCHTQS